MRRIRWSYLAGAVAAAFALAIVPTSGVAHGKARADLTISTGSVGVANGQVEGSFVVRNGGRRKAKPSVAVLAVRAEGHSFEVARYDLRALKRKRKRTVQVTAGVPAGLPVGSWPLEACADGLAKVREKSESNNCRDVGTIESVGGPTVPTSTVPTNPIPFTKNAPFELTSPQSNYWVDVPTAYDETHATKTTLFVWLHGCGDFASGDISTVSPGGAQDWISVAVGGREGGCWDVNSDAAKVLAAIADVKTHFNINPRSVILGGYSSGGDLTYRTAFYNSSSFAGVLVVNSSPFRDTGSSQSASLAAAGTKFHVVHLAHLQDVTYPIPGVRNETNAMTTAGFPLTRVEVDGGHFDAPGAIQNGHPVPGTRADIQTLLLPHIDDGWLSP